jgi:hypothetical protein
LGSDNEYTTAGGTSFAAPIFAGFIAILNGFEHAAGQGNINPELYKLAADPASYASAFHDITSGTNACSPSVGNCPTAGQSNFAATTGQAFERLDRGLRFQIALEDVDVVINALQALASNDECIPVLRRR